MPIAVRHAARVDDKGQVVFADPAAWRAATARHHGRDCWVTITRQQHARTLPQNRLYWVWVRDIAGYIGEDDKIVHEYLKAMHLPVRDVELLDGKHLTMPATTRLLTVEAFAEYMERVRVWSATFLGLPLPDASQVEAVL